MAPPAVLLAALLAQPLGACGGDAAPAADAAAADLSQAERDAYEGTIASLEGEVRTLTDQNQELRHRLEAVDLGLLCEEEQAEISRLQAEVQRYRDGLGRAVQELNRGPGGAAGAPAQRPMPTATPGAGEKDYGSVWAIGTPQVLALEGAVTVSGRLLSSRETTEEVRLTIYLLEDGATVQQTTKTMSVGAKTTVGYSHTFRYSPRAGKAVSARVEVSY